jgi:hypothetical protein
VRSGLELRWLTQEPGLTAGRIGARLLVPPSGETIDLGGTVIRFVRDPEVRAEGRLALVPAMDEPARRVLESPAVLRAGGLRVIALGWATVETDRTVREFAAALGVAADGEAAASDPLLGVTVRVIRDPRLPGGRVGLLEPSTEGRLAATLARDGEGPAALYLAPDDSLDAWLGRARSHGVAGSRPDLGPFGRAALVLGGPVAGPHLVVVDPVPDGG